MKVKSVINVLFGLLALLGVQAFAQTETLKVWAHDINMVADGKTITKLTISESDVVNYTGFNMSIIVPKGVTVARVRKGREYVDDIALNVDRATTDHTIACYKPDDSTIKVTSFNPNLKEYFPDDIDGNPVTEMFTIGLIADPTMINGTYDIQIIDCKFAPVDGAASVPGPISFKMTVTGGVDGVTVNSGLSTAGYGTLILPFDAEIPEGVEAYTCTDVLNGVVQTEKQSKITANVPLLIKGTPGMYTFNGKPTNEIDKTYTTGVLTGVYKDNVITSGYVLQQLKGVTGFYPVNANKPITVPANRCFLQHTEVLKAIMFDGSLTNIDELHLNGGQQDNLYNMQGKLVKNANVPGVYIKGDKKVIVK